LDEKTILLVEDNPNDVTLTMRALKKANIINEVVVTSDGEQALDYLFGTGTYQGRDLRQSPVVVLLDLKLPRIDGFEVLRRLRSDPRTSMTPVVILTTSGEERDLVNGYRLGANSYIRKPVDFNQFADAIRQLGLYWLVLNQPPPMAGGPAGTA
jgi:two-component system response regulator